MNIFLKSLTIVNFKGIKKYHIDFQSVTNVYGANRAGKSTLFDAFTWLLFGKDSADRKDFSIKPLDAKGDAARRIENEVTGVLVVDGEEITIRHIHKEKWVKKRGEEEAEFTGNEHLYFWNEVPLQAGEFQHKVNAILPESTFKLITNPLYFNSLKWQDRRVVLEDIAGTITDEDIAAKDARFRKLLDQLSGKTFKEYKAELSSKKKKIKDELEDIPGRIDEQQRSKLDPVDEAAVQAEIKSLQSEHDQLEEAITDIVKASEAENKAVMDIRKDINERKLANQSIELELKRAYNDEVAAANRSRDEAESRVRSLQQDYESKKRLHDQIDSTNRSTIDRLNKEIGDLNMRIENQRELFRVTNAKELDENMTVCKCSCGKVHHEVDDIETIRQHFIEDKTKALNAINEHGQSLAKELGAVKKQLSEVQERYAEELSKLAESLDRLEIELEEALKVLDAAHANDAGTAQVASVELRLVSHTGYNDNLTKIAELEGKLSNRPAHDFGDMRTRKAAISAEIDALRRKLHVNESNTRADVRIKELKDREKVLSQELADHEKQEFIMEQFDKAKSDELEVRVNSMFKLVKFRMFNRLINGGEEPTCVTLVDGVPFPDANNAAKIQAGIDIINTLSAHHGVTAPVFLDNRESVSEIPDTAAQVINLIVSPEDKELRVA
ncbi:AAA family ATPase [Parapedobacter soli]|uniref:AAA family ATPase n=1 Tax=Parapedobacter soli TaxID=416955 RepID=UPI0021CA9995|nr:AAA family ATPase [Parapedobacter soli]